VYGRSHVQDRALRRALRLTPSSVPKYSFRPVRLRSHPHIIDPSMRLSIHAGIERCFAPPIPALKESTLIHGAALLWGRQKHPLVFATKSLSCPDIPCFRGSHCTKSATGDTPLSHAVWVSGIPHGYGGFRHARPGGLFLLHSHRWSAGVPVHGRRAQPDRCASPAPSGCGASPKATRLTPRRSSSVGRSCLRTTAQQTEKARNPRPRIFPSRGWLRNRCVSEAGV